jgi:hypothetical protein
MTSATLIPDLTVANAFLAALDPHGSFTFQTFDDNKDRKDRTLAKIFHGTLSDHAAALAALQNKGAGVFVMVNEGDGKGRAASNVIRVRAHFVDLDGAPIEPVLEAAAPPNIVVESSPGKWHAYWLLNDCDLPDFKPGQQAMAAKFTGDRSVCDLSRVLRIPGFWHLKENPFQTRLVRPIFQG